MDLLRMACEFGTLEELFEIMTFNSPSTHSKPWVSINVNGYTTDKFWLISKLMEWRQGFLYQSRRNYWLYWWFCRARLDRMAAYVPKEVRIGW